MFDSSFARDWADLKILKALVKTDETVGATIVQRRQH